MKIAVSACLLGRNCKYNGGNNRSQAVLDFLKGHVVIPVCPEVTGRSACAPCACGAAKWACHQQKRRGCDRIFPPRRGQTMVRLSAEEIRPCHTTAAPVPPADAERFTTAPFPEKRFPARGCLPKPLRMQGFRCNPQRKSKTYKKKRRKLPFWGILLRFFVSFFMLTAPLPRTAAVAHFWDFQKYP